MEETVEVVATVEVAAKVAAVLVVAATAAGAAVVVGWVVEVPLVGGAEAGRASWVRAASCALCADTRGAAVADERARDVPAPEHARHG